MYESFAYIYDELMEEAPYDEWYEFFENSVKKYHHSAIMVLDVGCGTGEMLLRYLKNGYEAIGVDLSAHMLAVASEKINQSGFFCPLFELDMRSLDGLPKVDVVTVFCDSLNYLVAEKDVQSAFRQFAGVLKEDGLLLFDVHSRYKMNHIFHEATFAEDYGHLAYIWQTFPGPYRDSVEHELTFFVEKRPNCFEKMYETHLQRTFPVETYERWLKEADFEVLKICADFGREVSDQSERIFFIAKKRKF